MFGLSLGKLIVFALVVGVVWFGWRKLADAGKALQQAAERKSAPKPDDDEDQTIDLVRDPKTGAYKPRNRD